MIGDRVLHRLGVPTEPEHVEKASRRERIKRRAWMVLSTVIALMAAGATGSVAAPYVADVVGPELALALFVGWIIVWFTIDSKYIFPWGVERFDIVVPWQFRDEPAKVPMRPEKCPECGNGRLQYSCFTHRPSGKRNASWQCPHCGESGAIE